MSEKDPGGEAPATPETPQSAEPATPAPEAAPGAAPETAAASPLDGPAAAPIRLDGTPPGVSPGAAQLAAELEETKDKLLRTMAEAENVRRRAERDRAETIKYASANLARDVLVLADNLRRALDAVDPDARKGSEALEALAVGLEMVERQTMGVLESHGVRAFDALGKRLDPHMHEAMYEYDDPAQPSGMVGQVVEAGYMIHGRLLRPAKVGVTKGGPKPDAHPAAAAAPAASAETEAPQAAAPEPPQPEPQPEPQPQPEQQAGAQPAPGANPYQGQGGDAGGRLDEST
ncbi:MAG: nucleotide exchange factor GrpE [Rhodospirillales bacterium]